MARPYTITQVTSIPLNSVVENIIEGIQGRIVPQDSFVEVAANMGDADVSMQMTVGADQVLPPSPVNLEAAAGVLPSIRDDKIIETFAQGQDELIIRGQNLDVVAAAELRVVIRVTPIDDVQLVKAMRDFGAASAQAAKR